MRLRRVPITELRVVHLGGYWRGVNDIVRQMMLGLRQAGAGVIEVNTDEIPEALDAEGRVYDRGAFGPVWLRWEVVGERVSGPRPHLVICNAGGLAFRPEIAGRLRESTTLLGIALSDPDVHAVATRKIAPTFDVFLTNAPTLVPAYRALGIAALEVPAATNEEFFHPVPARRELECDVLVLGRSHPDRIEPVRRLKERFSTHVYGEGWEEHGIASRGFVYGDDALAALCSARTAVIFFKTGAGHPLVKVGLFDFLAAGAMVVSNFSADTARYLRFGEELEGFVDCEDLVDRIGALLADPERREWMRRQGRERVLREYTWRTVWPRLLDEIAGYSL